MVNLLKFDLFITSFLKDVIPHNLFFNYLFSFFSLKGNSILVWILVIIIAVIFEERKNPGISKRDKKFAALFLVVFITTTLFVEFPLKNLFHRLRPAVVSTKANFQLTIYSCPKDYSFPSGHASTAFAAATVLTFFNKKRKWLYYLTAILISYSRIYLGCHYLFDVLFGALLGYFISKVFLKFLIRNS